MWNELVEARIAPCKGRVKLTNTKNTFKGVRGAYLQLVGEEGCLLYSAPIRDDLNADQLCTTIKRKCEDATAAKARYLR